MISIMTNLLTPSAMQSLGWALLHFLWQGTALAALAAAAMAVCRRASVRYLVAVAALVLMLLAPFATFVFYSVQHSGVADAAKSSPLAAEASPIARDRAAASGSTLSPVAPRMRASDALPWLVEAWLLGVACLSLRSAGGFFLLERERRRQSSVVSPRVLEICYTLQDRIGIRRAIDYCECKWLQAPAVIGWFRPVVFLPVTALTGLSEEQLESVIAHELAHIQRLDPFVNVFQVCVETVLFYHPAVWWLNQRIRAEREHCCDETAVALCGNAVEYARALTLMEEWRGAPVLAMAANRGPLTERIVRVLGLKTLGAGMRGIGLTASVLCLAAALVAGNALLGMAHPASAHAAALWQSMPMSLLAPQQPEAPSTPKPSAAQPSATQHSATQAQSSDRAAADRTSSSAGSYVEEMKSVGLTDLSVDQLVTLKIQSVTAEYVRELQSEGLHPDVERLIAMKIQGVSPEYVHAFRQSGLSPDENELITLKIQGADAEYYRGMIDAGLQADVNHLIALKIQGATPEYVRELHATGIALSADQVIALKIQGATPEYVRELHATVLALSGDQVIALKIQGVTPAYLKELHAQGIDPDGNDAVAMKIQNVTPEYVREIQAFGLKPSVHELISMRIQNVAPEYIKALQTAGFKLSVEEIISAKIQDVTPEFIKQVQQHGFKDLTLQKLIELRQLGILDSKAEL